MKMIPAALALIAFGCASFAAGVYTGTVQPWPVRPVRRLIATLSHSAIQSDEFGRLQRYPGKTEISCPMQNKNTAVLLVAGQSNAGNFQGQGHQSLDGRVINFLSGRCYRAASPLLGADGKLGETWTLLGIKLVQSGLYNTVILIPAAVGASSIDRWAVGGELNNMIVSVIQDAQLHYTITGVLWDQGAEDYARHTTQDRYRSDLKSLIGTIRGAGVHAPFFITRCSIGGNGWSEDNPISRAQASLADGAVGIFDGPNTDHDLTPFDRYDGYHFAATGQEKYTDTWVGLLRAHPGT